MDSIGLSCGLSWSLVWSIVVAAIAYKTSPVSFKAYTMIARYTLHKDSKTFERIMLQLNEVSDLNRLKEYALKQL